MSGSNKACLARDFFERHGITHSLPTLPLSKRPFRREQEKEQVLTNGKREAASQRPLSLAYSKLEDKCMLPQGYGPPDPSRNKAARWAPGHPKFSVFHQRGQFNSC